MSHEYRLQMRAFAEKHLLGHHITFVGHADAESTTEAGFDEAPVVIGLSNGVQLIVLQDPEGNGPGVVECSTGENEGDEAFLLGPL